MSSNNSFFTSVLIRENIPNSLGKISKTKSLFKKNNNNKIEKVSQYKENVKENMCLN